MVLLQKHSLALNFKCFYSASIFIITIINKFIIVYLKKVIIFNHHGNNFLNGTTLDSLFAYKNLIF